MTIITRPEHDPTTRYLSAWCHEILKNAGKKAGSDYIDLHKKKASRKGLEGRVKKLDPNLLILHGHGDDGRIAGHRNETLIDVQQNAAVLYGRIAYAISCSVAKTLGIHVASKPNTTFIGYDDKFVFGYQHEKLGHPLNDTRAAPFMEMSNAVSLSLLKGSSAEEAYNRSQAVGMRHVKRLLSSASADPDARFDAFNLLWNLQHQVCLGQKNKQLIANI